MSNPPSPHVIYEVILDSISSVAMARLEKVKLAHPALNPSIYPQELKRLLDEMARNSAQAVICLFPEVYK